MADRRRQPQGQPAPASSRAPTGDNTPDNTPDNTSDDGSRLMRIRFTVTVRGALRDHLLSVPQRERGGEIMFLAEFARRLLDSGTLGANAHGSSTGHGTATTEPKAPINQPRPTWVDNISL